MNDKTETFYFAVIKEVMVGVIPGAVQKKVLCLRETTFLLLPLF